MVAKPVDVLDRIFPTARRWAGPDPAGRGDASFTPDDRDPGRHHATHGTGPNGHGLNGAAAGAPDDAAVRPRATAAHGPQPDGSQERAARRPPRLARVIETEVVPRLVLAGRAAACGSMPGPDAVAPGPEDVVALVGLVIADDAAAAVAYVEALRVRGVALERLYLDLFAVVARRLGQLWTEDLCSFADVTVGLVRLQSLVREFSPAFLPSVEAHDPRRSALLIPLPGEQHTFGIILVAEFFQRAGWEVHSDPMASEEELSNTVRNRWFAVAGITVGNDDRLEGLAALIRRVRRESLNRGIGVMVGGRVFSERPELAGMVGADATATDGRQAALQAETLLALLATRN